MLHLQAQTLVTTASAVDDPPRNDSGSFATCGFLARSPNPQIYVHGLGSISLPSSDQDTVALRVTCQQAPFGMGGEVLKP